MDTSFDMLRTTANAIAQLRPGDHACQLYATEDEHRAVLTPFMQHGLERGERVLYVADFHTAAEIQSYLRDTGLDVETYLTRDQLRLVSPADTYLHGGEFDPQEMIARLQTETELALRDGYTALRVTGEMTWALRGLPGSDRLLEYEIALERFFADAQALAICQYDRRRFSPELLLRVVEVHPHIIIGTEVCDNFYFVPSGELARPDHVARQLARQLNTLIERRHLEVELWQRRRHLEQEVLSRTRALEESNVQLQHEVQQRQQTTEALRQSAAFLKQTQQITQVGGWEYDATSRRVIWTDEVYAIHEVGTDFDPSDIDGALHFYAPPDQARIDRAFQRAVESGEAYDLELQFISAAGRLKWVRTIGQTDIVDGRVKRVFGNIMDITRRKRAEQTLQARLRLAQFAADHSLHELLVATLDEAGQLTGSPIGFYHFLAPDQRSLTLQAWSTRTTAEFCTAEGAGLHYNIDRAGVWVEAVRERRAIIHNDYAALPAECRKGLPPGHAKVERELVVPVFRGEQIVAILGVGNKPQPYDDSDVATVSLLADLAWDLAERKRAEVALREAKEFSDNLIASLQDGFSVLDAQGVHVDVNPALCQMTGFTREELVGAGLPHPYWPPEELETIERAFQQTARGEARNLELVFQRKNGQRFPVIVNPSTLTDGHGQIIGYAATVKDITDLKRMADAERAQRALAEALRDVATALNSTLNLDEVFDQILLNVGRIVSHEAASIMLMDDRHAIARVARYHGYAAPGVEVQVRSLQFEVDHTRNLKTLYDSRRPLIIADVHTYPGWRSSPERAWIRSYAGVPIRSREHVIGFLNLYSSQAGFYSAAQIEPLQAFADQAAVAVENAQLHARIQQQVDELEQRVADRTRELTAANVRLTELDRLKDEFISRISHELRTPLTSIRIYLDLLENGKADKREKYLRTLNEQSERLQGLIESLLDVSRLNVTRNDVQLHPINLNHAASELVNDSQAAAVRRGLNLRLETATVPPVVQADAVLLPQALSPLMSNALAYTPAGGSITVTTALQQTAEGAWGTLTVRDTGPGLDPSEVNLIFERFYRGLAARDYKTPGTGLGLFISHELIEKCGGRITVDSVPGQGAAFTVWLPLT